METLAAAARAPLPSRRLHRRLRRARPGKVRGLSGRFPSHVAHKEEAMGLCRRLLGRGQGWPGSGDGKSRADSGAAAPGRRCMVHRASTCFLPWWRDPALERRPDLQQAARATSRLWIRCPGRHGGTWRWPESPRCLSLSDWCG
jgi:hypothetical protein